MTDKIVVLSTCATREEADRIALSLLDKRLAACINVLPGVESIYHWKGKVERSQEFLLIIKSSRKCFEQLQTILTGVHSYDVPEVLALPVVAGAESYLAWMDREMQTSED